MARARTVRTEARRVSPTEKARLSRGAYWISAWFANKNANAPANNHYDMQVGDYVDNNCGAGYHWS